MPTDIEIRALFKMCDKNGDGVLSPSELAFKLSDFGFSETEISTALLVMDTNGDGVISFEEFEEGFGIFDQIQSSFSRKLAQDNRSSRHPRSSSSSSSAAAAMTVESPSSHNKTQTPSKSKKKSQQPLTAEEKQQHEEAIRQLAKAFPSWDREALEDVVREARGKVETAIQWLMMWTTSAHVMTTADEDEMLETERRGGGGGGGSGNYQQQQQKQEVKSPRKESSTTTPSHKMTPSKAGGGSLIFGDNNNNSPQQQQQQQRTTQSSSTSYNIKPRVMARSEYDRVMSSRLMRKTSPSSMLEVFRAVATFKARLTRARQQAALFRQASDESVNENGNNNNNNSNKPPQLALSPSKTSSSSVTAPFSPSSSSALSSPAPPKSREEAIAAGMILLSQRLSFLGLESVSMLDDGNCQFRAFSQELFGVQDHHLFVRKTVVDYLLAHSDEFRAFFSDDEWDRYISSMQRDRTWGDELTLRAAADSFKVIVHVVTSENTNWYLRYDPPPRRDKVLPFRSVFLAYISPVHYNTIAPLR